MRDLGRLSPDGADELQPQQREIMCTVAADPAGYVDAPRSRSRQPRQSPAVRRAVTGDVRLAGTAEPDPEPSPVTLYRYVQ